MKEILVKLERQLAESHEECMLNIVEVDSLRAALEREKEANQHNQARLEGAMQELRDENASHTQQLMEQITVLKMLAESVMEEKAHVTEEAKRQRQEMLALLEQEREEKSQIMGDYRQQTESLIAEQGREITTLRMRIQAGHDEHERLLCTRQELEGKLKEQRERVAELEKAIAKSRLDQERCKHEEEQRYATRIEELMEQNRELTIRIENEAAKQQMRQQEVEEQARTLSKQLRTLEEAHAMERHAAQAGFRRELEELREQLCCYESKCGELERDLERERGRACRNEEKVTQTLREAVEKLREEKTAAVQEAMQQREGLCEQHRNKVNQLQGIIDGLRRQLADESVARNDAESARDLANTRVDDLQTAVISLRDEIETIHADYRSRERAAVQERHSLQEQLRAALRKHEEEIKQLQQDLLQHELEEKRLRDEVNIKAHALQSARAENKQLHEEMQRATETNEHEMMELQKSYEQNAAIWSTQKTQAEAECQRLQGVLLEAEARQQACERHLADERRTLNELAGQLRESRDAAEQLQATQRRAHARQRELEEEVRQAKTIVREAEARIIQLEASLESRENTIREQAAEAARIAKEHEAELQSRHKSQEENMMTLQNELRIAREEVSAKEEELRCLREDITKLRCEAAVCAGSWQEELSEAKKHYEDDIRRLDEVLNTLRTDLSKAQASKAQCLKEMAQAQLEVERQYSKYQEIIAHEQMSKEKALEDNKHKEQLNNELQGTVRLLSARLSTFEDDIRRLQEENGEANTRLHEAHMLIGRKDAAIGQLTARVRAYEARMEGWPLLHQTK
ncbi:hypothetical protein TRVL_06239 [Trypanosoma vivax]|nr:hypothetical protein TRVL_06239 [Trypanosoma vivax]